MSGETSPGNYEADTTRVPLRPMAQQWAQHLADEDVLRMVQERGLTLPAPHPQGGTEALRARLLEATQREVDAPTDWDCDDNPPMIRAEREAWAWGYTAACDTIRALLAAAPAPTEAGDK